MKCSTLILAMVALPVFLLALGPAKASKAASLRPDLYIATRLAYGQTLVVPRTGISLTFQEVDEDSRCPIEATCLREGAVEISLLVEYESDGATQSVQFRLAGNNRSELANGSWIILKSVDPYPVMGSTMPLEDYYATLVVTSRGTWD